MTYFTEEDLIGGITEDDWIMIRNESEQRVNPNEPVEEPEPYDGPAKPF